MTSKQIIIPTGRSRNILADISYIENGNEKPLIIFCHGYKGYKDWGAWNLVAEEFAKAGYIFLKFNFSHNGGTIENPIDFPDLTAFGENTYTKEVEDLHTVIDWTLINHGFPISKNKTTIIGHSRGGGVVSIVAKEHRAIANLITWAGVSDYKSRFLKGDKLHEWKENGVYYVINGRTKQEMPHFYSFYEDFIKNEQRLNIKSAIKQLNKPHLIIHGDNDKAVPLSEAQDFKKWNPLAKLKVIEGSNHTFGSKHPYLELELPEYLKRVVLETLDFIR